MSKFLYDIVSKWNHIIYWVGEFEVAWFNAPPANKLILEIAILQNCNAIDCLYIK